MIAVRILKKMAKMVQIILSVSDRFLLTAHTSYITHMAQASPIKYNRFSMTAIILKESKKH
jgi:hypothetical protein